MAEAVSRLTYGNTLATRGATAAAREEFLAGLSAVADARDAAAGGTAFRTALEEGLTCLRELKDFFGEGPAAAVPGGTAGILRTHASHVVPPEKMDSITRTEAIALYRRAAAERLIVACDGDEAAVASIAAIGKLHALRLQLHDRPDQYDFCVAVLCNQIALRCVAGHPRYANELGVLMASAGELDQARDLFLISLRGQETVETWNNLARVHELRGEAPLADLARNEAARLAGDLAQAAAPGRVRWVSPDAFGAGNDIDAAHAPAASRDTEGPAARSAGNGRESPASGIFRR